MAMVAAGSAWALEAPANVDATAAGPVSTASYGARCIGSAFDDTAAFQAAIDTGHTVYAPALGGQCHVTRALVMRTPGQIFHGDGRARTKIVVEPDFRGAGVFVAKTGEPGPVWRDLSVSFAQPDTDHRAALVTYPPAFLARDTPRFEMAHVGCFLATWCVDMKGNSGGASLDDVQMSAFAGGIAIDGSLDTVRLTSLHWYPFALSSRQQRLFSGATGCPVGIETGRMDDLIVRASLFGGCLGLRIVKSASGSTSGSVSDSDFDTYSGIEQDGGVLLVADSHFALGVPKAQAVVIRSGILSVTGSFFLAGVDGEAPMIENAGSVHFSLTGNTFLMAGRDVTSVSQEGGVALLDANAFLRDKAGTALKPVIDVTGGDITVFANQLTTSTPGAGAFLWRRSQGCVTAYGNLTSGWRVEGMAVSPWR